MFFLNSRGRKKALLGAAIGLVIVGALAWFFLARRPMSKARMMAHLPAAESPLLFVDVALLRKSAVLNDIAGSGVVEAPEYKTFIEKSGFNYRTDLDALIASFQGDQTFVVAAGRFDWPRLERYMREQGGVCENGFCRIAGSTPGRNVSFVRLRSGVLGFASSPNPLAAAGMRQAPGIGSKDPLPVEPVWLLLPGATLRDANHLPAGTRLFAKALENSERLLLAAGMQGGQVEVRLDAAAKNEEDAVILRAQLEKVTDVMTKFIARLNQKPNPRDLSGILTGGRFRREGRHVIGTWPVRKEFLESLGASR